MRSKTKLSTAFLSMFLSGSIALYGCAPDTPASGHIQQTSSLSVDIEGPADETYPVNIDLFPLAPEDDTISGIASFLDEDYDVSYSILADRESFTAVHATTGDLLHLETTDQGWTISLDVDGQSSSYHDEPGLRGIDYEASPAATKLMLLAQVSTPMRAELLGAGSPYWVQIVFIVVIAAGAVAYSCTGTELACNGEVQVTCPDGSEVTDLCGCGDSICNKCVPNTCADTCEQGFLCPENQLPDPVAQPAP